MKRFWGICVIILIFFISGCQIDFISRLPNVPWHGKVCYAQEQNHNLNIRVLPEAIKVLNKEFIEAVNPNKLLNGAVKGINAALKGKNLQDTMEALPLNAGYEQNLYRFASRYKVIKDKYQSKFENSSLIYAALKGLMAALNDPYSVAMSPKEYRILTEQMSGGNFSGIGIYIELDKKNNNQLTVIEPIEETPAYQAGIKSGDLIVAIDGLATKGLALDVATNHIRGPEGSTVKLLIKRKGEASKNYTIVRKFIHISSTLAKMYKGNIGYIKLRFFGEDTKTEFKESLDKLENAGMKALAVDLRNNGGGYLNASIDVCSNFLPQGTIVVSEINNRIGRYVTHRSYGDKSLDIPVVLLVNRYSASAAEITAGALQDTGKAVLIGEKTFGKASVQTINALYDGGAIKYTIAHYITPKGRDINKKGIQPDIEIKMETDKVGGKDDIQRNKALNYLYKKLNSGANG